MFGSFDRRFVLRAGAAGIASALIPFPEWFDRYGAADAQPVKIRRSVAGGAGAAMLADYRTAVAAMSGRAAGNPCSWVFQWYTHQVRDDIGKAAAVAALNAAERPLANEVWSTCQAHFGRPVRFFLPWHRMYLYFLERIVRAASGNPAFAMPYWNYLNAAQHALPAAFRTNPASPLFRSHRSGPANAGQAIDINNPGAFTQNCMTEAQYLPSLGHSGFCGAINGDPHGIVHSLIGDSVGMGTVPWAANDPIFWLHHCNIDRMWAHWNASGHANPTDPAWLNQTFVFADEKCNRVAVRVGDFQSLTGLDYTYDDMLRINPVILERLRRLMRIAHWPPPIPGPDPAERGPVVLGERPVTVPLRATQGRPEAFRNALAQAREIRLSIGGLRTNAAPGILYDVYIGVPRTAGRTAGRIRVGTITFFDAVVSPEHADAGHDMEMPSFNFDVTRAVKRLRSPGQLEVTIVPHGKPASGARPEIAQFELFSG